jgi:hypothetical protein
VFVLSVRFAQHPSTLQSDPLHHPPDDEKINSCHTIEKICTDERACLIMGTTAPFLPAGGKRKVACKLGTKAPLSESMKICSMPNTFMKKTSTSVVIRYLPSCAHTQPATKALGQTLAVTLVLLALLAG